MAVFQVSDLFSFYHLHDLLVKGKSKLCFSNSSVLGLHTRAMCKDDPMIQ